jgi:hypothetical protein
MRKSGGSHQSNDVYVKYANSNLFNRKSYEKQDNSITFLKIHTNKDIFNQEIRHSKSKITQLSNYRTDAILDELKDIRSAFDRKLKVMKIQK